MGYNLSYEIFCQKVKYLSLRTQQICRDCMNVCIGDDTFGTYTSLKQGSSSINRNGNCRLFPRTVLRRLAAIAAQFWG